MVILTPSQLRETTEFSGKYTTLSYMLYISSLNLLNINSILYTCFLKRYATFLRRATVPPGQLRPLTATEAPPPLPPLIATAAPPPTLFRNGYSFVLISLKTGGGGIIVWKNVLLDFIRCFYRKKTFLVC